MNSKKPWILIAGLPIAGMVIAGCSLFYDESIIMEQFCEGLIMSAFFTSAALLTISYVEKRSPLSRKIKGILLFMAIGSGVAISLLGGIQQAAVTVLCVRIFILVQLILCHTALVLLYSNLMEKKS